MSSFHFQQFTIKHRPEVMKVSTDSVLLGSWATLSSSTHLLDVGCGSGLLCLMAAQRQPSLRITGIDNSPEAVCLALENVAESSWSERISISLADMYSLSPDEWGPFDYLMSNPPYFSFGTRSALKNRNAFRHTSQSFFAQLFAQWFRLSAKQARCSLIAPLSHKAQLVILAMQAGWYLTASCKVRHHKGSDFNLCMLEWKKGIFDQEPENTRLTLWEGQGQKTRAFSDLTAEFYLK